MEENKNLVISYYYYVKKEHPEEAGVHKRIDDLRAQIISDGVNNIDVKEVEELILKSSSFSKEKMVKVFKEYPEFLAKDFKTKEELFDFLDEDEPAIYRELEVWFEKVPDCLKEIGIEERTWKSCNECVDYIEAKHAKEGN